MTTTLDSTSRRSPDDDTVSASSRALRVLKARELPVGVALVVLIVGTYLINDRFLSPQSVKDLMLNATISGPQPKARL